MKKIIINLLLAVGLALILTACGNVNKAEKTDLNTDAEISTDTEVSTDKSISFVDDDGTTINMDKPAEKIIVMYSAHMENLFYLGAEDRIIGGYKTCNFPPKANDFPKYDYTGDPEAVIAAAPDLVIVRPVISKKAPDYIAALRNAGITVVSLYPDKLEEFDDYIYKLAEMTDTEERAKELLADFHNELDEIKAVTSKIEPKKTIFFESTEKDIRTATAASMPGVAIETAGGINIAKDAVPVNESTSIAPFGEEQLLANADKIDVYVAQRGGMNSGATKEGISARPGFDVIKAVKENNYYTINEKIISSPTFRYVYGVKELARIMYPEVMNNVAAYENDNEATRGDLANILYMSLNIPLYAPTSSNYYETEHNGHVFGLFDDVSWEDPDFYAVESVVDMGYMDGFKENETEAFRPDLAVTRDELAKALFSAGGFTQKEGKTTIADLDESDNTEAIQALVDNGVFDLTADGKSEPKRNVTNNEIVKAINLVK